MGALLILWLYACSDGQGPQRSWERVTRSFLGRRASDLCISGGGMLSTLFAGCEVIYLVASVECMCLMVWRPGGVIGKVW